MQVPKPSEADKAWFRSIVPADPRVEVKPMFGNLGAFVNGNMFMGLFGPDIGLKLAPGDAAQLRAVDGAGPYGPPQRPMAGWVSIPASWRGDARVDEWTDRALRFVEGMPAKGAKRGPASRTA